MVHYEVKYKVEFAWKEGCCSLTLTQKIFFLGFKQQMYYSSVKSYDGIESHASKHITSTADAWLALVSR